ncbi:AAA family ATPase [Glycomyces rhizosphaerae]|uniref:AAA family ATPase n=1 Tax=Glycomyces rhizosphaerae TaxID=2054422 RepID=A0ABV7Q0H9_9ACTN
MSFSTATASVLEVWSRGVELLRKGDLVRASDCFEHVLEYDPRAADAWLGVHACGQEQLDEAVLGMLEHRSNLGRLRKATGLALKSSFEIGMFVSHPLRDAYDAWLAFMAGLIDSGQLERAGEALAAADSKYHDQDDRIKLLRTRCSFERGEWEEVLEESHGIKDASLHDEAQFYVAASLVQLKTHYEALNAAKGLPTAISDPVYNAHIYFVRGAALEALGEDEQATQAFQRAYRLAPDYEVFAERAKAARPAGTTRTTAESPLRSFSGGGPGGDDRAKQLADAGRRLDAMIGLQPVKDQIHTLKAQFRMAALKRQRGLQSSSRPQHFVFTGPPGTGKTTVARIMGEILAGLGLLEHGKVVETQRGDLVGQYLGSTALKTREKIDEATGGVLFIDEAYSLANQGYDGDADAFGDEAMQEILTAAENRRDRLVIVLAGYTDEIHELLATNPGLKSRFSTVIEFPSYSAEELTAIGTSILTAAGESLSAEAERALHAGCAAVVNSGQIDALGNGRFARELCHKAAAQRDLRLLGEYGDSGTPSTAEMTTIEALDIVKAYEELAT